MATSRDKYYMEIFKTITDYNYRNNTSLSYANIREAICKIMEQKSIADANNVTADTFIHTSNTQRDNANTIFTNEKLDKSDELVDAVKKFTINDSKYYESNTTTASDSQGYIKRNPETFTHTSNGNKTVNHTSNSNFEQRLLRNRTIPFVVPMMSLRIDKSIAPIVKAPQILLAPAITEVAVDMVQGRAWVNRTQ